MPFRCWVLSIAVVINAMCCTVGLADEIDDYLANADPKVLFEQVCSTCHNLNLPMSQRLNRANWEWVVGDMVENGCKFVDRRVKDRIVNYLVENYGPNRPR